MIDATLPVLIGLPGAHITIQRHIHPIQFGRLAKNTRGTWAWQRGKENRDKDQSSNFVGSCPATSGAG
jgi:hypothetical protein